MSVLNSFLTGLRVLDLSRHLPGPLATLMLADMGAEVLKLEPPAGDEMRAIGPQSGAGRSIYYEAVNGGKTIARIDLTKAAERDRFLALVDGADILVESFRPGVMERLGIGHDLLRRRNPRLICCALSGFGRDGPLAQRAGHDANYLSLAGVLSQNGADAPLFFDPPLADCTASLMAVIAILGALQRRHASGEGCLIDLALADAVMPLQSFQLAALGAIGHVPRRGRDLLNGGAAYYRVYRTADGGHVSLGAIEPKFWRRFCEAAGRADWFARQAETLPQTALAAEIAAFFSSLTLAEAVARFEPADCCVAPVLDLAEAVRSPHVQQRQLLHRLESGAFAALFPAKIDGEAPRPRRALREAEPGA
jgi:alpha-methylacyl-CoA racemase